MNLVQACYNIENKETKDREIKSLKKAMLKFKIKKGIIATVDKNEKIVNGNFEIEIITFLEFIERYKLSI